MRSHEIEAIEAGHQRPAARHESEAPSPELAARAAVAGRTEALAPAAVLRLQRAAGNAGVAAALESEQESPVRSVVGRGSGQPIAAPVRQRMEASFGADFSDVRVHSGGSAAASAQALDAHAYTVGNEIVLGDGQTPGSPTHERTLAHELTHVVQQRSGPVDGTPTTGGISVSDPADRFERAAETTADTVMSSGRAPDAGSGVSVGRSLQREGREEEPAAAEPGTSAETAQAGPDMSAETAQAAEPGTSAETAQAGPATSAETAQAGPDTSAETAQAGAPADGGLVEDAGLAELEDVQELAIQRAATPEEEEVQQLAIQRIHREEEEERLLL
jgi:hypothetical protein